jgi:hypothetical protein
MIRGVLLDEHYYGWWPPTIRRQCPAIDLRAIGLAGAPPSGTKDPQLLQRIEAHDFVLVTEDRKTMVVHLNNHLAAGRHVEGIFIVHKKLNVRVLAGDLELIVGASYEGEFRDQIIDLPL